MTDPVPADWWPAVTTTTNTVCVLYKKPAPPPSSSLRSVQEWLQARPFPLWWLGNRVSTLRYWLWRACR